MKRVVVIGSKPDAVIPDGDVIYCANASIVYYADQVARFSRIVNISTPRVIDEQKPQSVSVEQDPVTAWGVLLNNMQAKLVILESSNASRMIDTLRKAGYGAPITSISDQERRKLVTKVSGCDDPILTADFFHLPPKLQVRYAGSATSIILKRLFDQSKTCNSIFRPSTGIISLLMAIDENGVDCEYILAGIGLKNRDDYLHTKRSSSASFPIHVFADRKILQVLSSRYRITSTEPELMAVLPLFAKVDIS